MPHDNDSDRVADKVLAGIAASTDGKGVTVGVTVSTDDLQYAVRLIQQRCTGQLGLLFWAGKTGSSWTVRLEPTETP